MRLDRYPNPRGQTPAGYAKLLRSAMSDDEAVSFALSQAEDDPFWVNVLVALGSSIAISSRTTSSSKPTSAPAPRAKPAPAKAAGERTFYLGAHRAQWLAEAGVPLFVSRRTLEDRKTLPRATARWALDSGGFTELSMHGSWTVEAKAYAAIVRRLRDEIGMMDWAAPQDWMCEADMLKRTGLSIPEHIRRTVRNYLELRQIAPDLPIIPVLQGWTMGDYLDCAELYAKHGVDLHKLPVVGVGTVCRRQATMGAAIKLRWLADDKIQLHGFGLKKEGLEMAADSLVSADSMAWSLGARYEGKESVCPEGKKSCANCLHYALDWRKALLAKLGPAWNHKIARKGNPLLRVYRGESVHNKGGHFWTTDREWARQFTGAGLDREIREAMIDEAEIFRSNPLVFAGDPDAVDGVLAAAKRAGKKAAWLSEGEGQPDSLWVMRRSALLPSPRSKNPIEVRDVSSFAGKRRSPPVSPFPRLPDDVQDPAKLAKLINEAESILGVRVSSKILGCGSNGCAVPVGKARVLKLSSSRGEERAIQAILDADAFDGFARVFEGPVTLRSNPQFFAYVRETVTPLSPPEWRALEAWKGSLQELSDSGLNLDEVAYMEELRHLEVIPELRAMMGTLRAVAETGVLLWDIQPANFGWREGTIVLFDAEAEQGPASNDWTLGGE